MVSTSHTKRRRQWSRLAHACAVFQLCLLCQPSTSTASTSRRRQLRQPSQQQQEGGQWLNRPRSRTISVSAPRAFQTRIVNGRDNLQPMKDFPFFAQWYRGCGATLIHPDVLVTAAHCFSETLMDHRVRLEGDPRRTLRRVDAFALHPEYNSINNVIDNNAYDFMLLKLEAPVPFLRPVPLHRTSMATDSTSSGMLPLVDQEDLTIVGYGLTSEEGKVAAILQEGTVQYHADCSFSIYHPGKVGEDSMFCAHGRYNETSSVDSCQGDSGGPILRRTPQGWLQVGVTSWGEGCARPDAPGIYARTRVAYDWIQEQLCLLSQVPPPHCSLSMNDTTMTTTTTTNATANSNEEEEISEEGALSLAAQEDVSLPNLDETLDDNLVNVTTFTTTTLSLRIDVQYDRFPQEISWALALQQQNEDQQQPSSVLKHVSPRQPLSVRNQRLSQHVLNVEPGVYRLEFYDTISGDGISIAQDDAIQVWQLTTTTTTTTETTLETTTQVERNEDKQDTELEMESLSMGEEEEVSTTIVSHHLDDTRLLWSHRGDFGEFVRSTMEVAF